MEKNHRIVFLNFCLRMCLFPLSGDIHLLVDHFLDIFQESSIFKMQATLIINEIMLGTTGDNGILLIQSNLIDLMSS